jgi:hypothetical protein
MRIFLLGDSFTDNVYPDLLERIKNGDTKERRDGYLRYLEKIKNKNLPDPLHFEDYLRMWGHEVINFGSNGCTNYDIFYNFVRIDTEFREGDRIIINWTGMNRYNWIGKTGNCMSINGGKPDDYDTNPKTKLLFDQYLHRMESSKQGGYLFNHMAPFAGYLLNLHEKYKPIMWIPNDFPNEAFKEQRFYTNEPSNEIFKEIIPEFDKLTIKGETDIDDRHFGRWGNFYCAVIFNTILEYTKDGDHDGYYTKDRELSDRIEQAIRESKPNIRSISFFK